jgi:transposase
MLLQEPLVVTLVRLVDRLPLPPSPPKRGRGKPKVYSDRLFLKALVIMIVKRLSTAYELLSVLEQPTAEMRALKLRLYQDGRFPCRRTFERRLDALPATLPAQIGCLGRSLVSLLNPWQTCGRAAACDSTTLPAKGGVWHKKDREKGEVPHTSIDTEAHWTKSGWHGWVYGWKLHLAVSVSDRVWLPLAAVLTPANADDGETAPQLLSELPPEVRFVLGDRHYNRDDLRALCRERGRELVTSRYGKYPHKGSGKEVRRVFHKLRSIANENFNELFKSIFDGHEHVPTKGSVDTQRWALGAVLVYQLAVWDRFERHLDLKVGLKPYLKAA